MGITYIDEYCISSIIILIIILLTNRIKKKMKNTQNRLFEGMIWLTLGVAAVDIASGLAFAVPDLYPLWHKYQNVYLYYILLLLIAFIFLLYMLTLINRTFRELKLLSQFALTVPLLVSGVLLLSNPLTELLFLYDSQGSYRRGDGHWILYLLILFYLLFAAVKCISFRGALSRKMKQAFGVAILLVCGFETVKFFIPTQMYDVFGLACALLIVFLGIQKPDAYRDLITGLFNAEAFRKSFESNCHSKKKNHLILIYVEDTPALKQAVGVAAANQILKEVAVYLEERYPDNAYLFDSDIFSLMLRCDNDGDIRQIVHSLDERFREKWRYEDRQTDLTARIIEIRLPEDAENLETVFSYSNYLRALENSRKWVLYARTVDMQFLQRRLEVEGALRRAIETESFEMHYQPIYCISDNSIATAEALVRLADPELGRLSPAEFIPIAEKGGLILPISKIIFRKVFAFIRDNDLQAKGLKYIEINLSMIQCVQANFADQLSGLMQEYGISFNRINLEVTETAAVNSPRYLRENMEELYSRGIRFSLDDFGTGYSNIDALMDLPLDMIKLDKSIIDMATYEDKGKIVLGSAITMAKRIHMKIVAEGVETREQKEYLEEMGVDYLQGYYISRPITAEEFVEFIVEFNGKK